MKKEIKNRWVKKLKIAKKTEGGLHKKDGGMCCLGVLCEIYREEVGGEWAGSKWVNKLAFLGTMNFLPEEVQKWSGIKTPYGLYSKANLAALNDASSTFTPIIQAIEKHWKEL